MLTEVRVLQKGTVKSPDLAAALVEVYLGSNPPSKDMQTDFLSTVSSLISK